MDVSNCKPCKAALKKALLAGKDVSKLKIVTGHLEGCPALSPEKEATSDRLVEGDRKNERSQPAAYPWSEQNYQIIPSPRPEPAESGADAGGFGGASPHDQHPAAGGDRRQESRPAQPDRRGRSAPERAEHRGRARVPGPSYAEVAAKHEQKRPPVQQMKVVDHANKGEQRDHRKGVWFVFVVVLAVLTVPIFPPLALLYLGAIITLFVI